MALELTAEPRPVTRPRRQFRPYNKSMCIAEIRPGRGGQDAQRFAGEIASAISAWAARQGCPATTTRGQARAVTLVLPGIPPGSLR
jgi:hypothetical protein